MILVLDILLIVLGAIGAQTIIVSKIPASKSVLSKVSQCQEWLGLAGIFFGIVAAFEWLGAMFHAHGSFLHSLSKLAVIALALALGIILGFDVIRRNLKDPNVPFIAMIDGLRVKLVAKQQLVSLIGLAVGVFFPLLP